MEVIYLQRLCVYVIQTFLLPHEDFISEWLRWSSRERDVTSWHHVMITWRLVEMTSCVVERCYRELARSLVPTRARPWVVWGSERCRSCNSTGGISQPWSRLRLGCFLWISMASLILREQYFGSLARIRTSSKLMLWPVALVCSRIADSLSDFECSSKRLPSFLWVSPVYSASQLLQGMLYTVPHLSLLLVLSLGFTNMDRMVLNGLW